jgi:dTDP-4-dehydrorhamnose reductase
MPTKLVHNVTTGEVSEVELTTAELAQLKADQEKKIKEINEAQAKATAKAAILDRLGITADEAASLLS